MNEATKPPQNYVVHVFPDGRQLVLAYKMPLPIPKDTGRYYRVRATLLGADSVGTGILYNMKRRMLLDRSGFNDIIFILFDQNCPALAKDTVQSVEVLSELSDSEVASVSSELKLMMGRWREEIIRQQ